MRSHGFTLVEVAVASAILIVVLLYSVSFLGSSGASAQSARLSAQAMEIAQYVESALARGLEDVSPQPNQTLTLDGSDPNTAQIFSRLIPVRVPVERFRVVVENQGVRTQQGVDLYRYRIQVCYTIGRQSVCRTSTRLLPPPSSITATINYSQPFTLSIICPANITPQVDLTGNGSTISVTQCGDTTIPAGSYQITARPATDSDGIQYGGSITTGSNKITVTYAATSGSVELVFEYTGKASSGGSATFAGRTYTTSALIPNLSPGTYTLTANSFTYADPRDNLSYNYRPTYPRSLNVELGRKTRAVISYAPINGYVSVRGIDQDTTVTSGGLLLKVGNNVFSGNVSTPRQVQRGEQVMVYTTDNFSNPLQSKPIWKNGYPHRAVFYAKRAEESHPTCSEVLSSGISSEGGDQKNQYTLGLAPLGQHTVIYWCAKPAYGKLQLTSSKAVQIIGGISASTSTSPFLYTFGGSASQVDLYLPASSGQSVQYTLLANPITENGVTHYPTYNPGPNINLRANQSTTARVDFIGPERGKYRWYMQPAAYTNNGCDLYPPFPGDEATLQVQRSGQYITVRGPGLIEENARDNPLSVRSTTGGTITGNSGVEYRGFFPNYVENTDENTGHVTCAPGNYAALQLSDARIAVQPVYALYARLPYSVYVKATSTQNTDNELKDIKVTLRLGGAYIFNNTPMNSILNGASVKSNAGNTEYEKTINNKRYMDSNPSVYFSVNNIDRLVCQVSVSVAGYYADSSSGGLALKVQTLTPQNPQDPVIDSWIQSPAFIASVQIGVTCR